VIVVVAVDGHDDDASVAVERGNTIGAPSACTPIADWALSPLQPGDTAFVTGSCLDDSALRACGVSGCVELATVQVCGSGWSCVHPCMH
jgi:hypothetical protein